MRLFDIIGAAAVVTWLAIIGAFVYEVNFVQRAKDFGGDVIIREGESWMVLTRENEEVGYIHESRTELDDGAWLLEYDLLMNVSMLGIDQYLRTQIRAHVDANAYLDEFSADIETGGTTFDLTGRVEESSIVMSMNLAGEDREQRIRLNEPPRLSNSALNQLVAHEQLEPGMRFEQEYFDPAVMGMTTMTFEYVREHEVDVYDEKIPTLHFRQLVAGTELDVYVDRSGEVYIQEFPLRILAARVPPELGRARAKSMQREFEKQANKGANLTVETAVGLLKGAEAVGATGTTRYRLINIPEALPVALDSMEQRLLEADGTTATVDTASRGALPPARPSQHEPYLQSTLRVDFETGAFGQLTELNEEASTTIQAEQLARAVRNELRPAEGVEIHTASQALSKGRGDSTEFALVLVAALRRHGIPARFVTGVKRNSDGEFVPHRWVQYFNDSTFVDLDATQLTLRPGTGQIQFFTHAESERPELVDLMRQIDVEPIPREKPGERPRPESDFN